MKRAWVTGVLLLAMLTVSLARGQSTRPVSAQVVEKSDQGLEAETVRGTGDTQTATTRATVSAASGASDFSRIGFSLLVVIAIILILRAVLRQMAAGPGASRSGRLVSVLGRSMISPRQHVMVLQVGNRLLVVGDSSGRMNSLCEITDPDEIAMLVSQSKQPRGVMGDRPATSFLNLFKRANESFTEPDALQTESDQPAKPVDPDEAVTTQEMHGLMDKVRMLQEQFRVKSIE